MNVLRFIKFLSFEFLSKFHNLIWWNTNLHDAKKAKKMYKQNALKKIIYIELVHDDRYFIFVWISPLSPTNFAQIN